MNYHVEMHPGFEIYIYIYIYSSRLYCSFFTTHVLNCSIMVLDWPLRYASRVHYCNEYEYYLRAYCITCNMQWRRQVRTPGGGGG